MSMRDQTGNYLAVIKSSASAAVARTP